MSDERSDFREALREAARAAAGEAGRAGHPGLDRLAAYHEGALSEAETEPVREHLSLCRECADLLLDWRDFAREEPAGAPSAAAAAWKRDREGVRAGVLRRVGAGAPARRREDAGEAAAARQRAAPRRAPLVPWLAAAAAAAIALVLAVLWWQARSELRQPRQVALASVAPEGSSVLRGREEEAELLTGPRSRPVVLLHLAERPDFPRYEARIVPESGAGAASVVELDPGLGEVLALDLGADPEPGDYRVTLFGVAGGERQEVATYSFRVHAP